MTEFKQTLSRSTKLAGSELRVTFTAQVVPVSRGIVSSLYGKLAAETTEEEALLAYRDFYRDEPFVRIYDSSAAVGSLARQYRVSAESLAISSEAEIPLPETSATTTASRPSGSGT